MSRSLTDTDARLIARYVRTGSDPAFRELVERHLPMVYATALRVVAGDSHLAQDVAQTVFTELARSASSLAGVESLGGWLYRVAYNMAANAVRAESRRRARERTAMELDEINDRFAAGVQWNQLAPVLDEALNQLDDRDRTAIVLRYLQSSDLRSVGSALGLSDDAAQKRISRALDKLREFLGRRGLSFSAVVLAATLDAGAKIPVPAGLAAAVAASSASSAASIAGVATGIHSSAAKIAAVLVAGAVIAASAVYVVQTKDTSPPVLNPVAAPVVAKGPQSAGGTVASTAGQIPVTGLAGVPVALVAAATTAAETAAAAAQPAPSSNADAPSSNGANGNTTDAKPATVATNNSADTPSQTLAATIPVPGQAWAVPLAGDAHLDLLPVNAGHFVMGSPPGEDGRRSDETSHQVTITRPFWLGEFTVSRQQFSALAAVPPDAPIMALPVNVTWMQAEAYCQALTERERAAGRLPAGYEYRLPTEAEWEYACRADTNTPYYSGGGPDDLSRVAWYRDNFVAQVPSGRFTLMHPAGQKQPNNWGFYDMLGNVAQWCADLYAPYSIQAAVDPVGQLAPDQFSAGAGVFHVLRGGNFARSAAECRAAARSLTDLDTATGFRVALAPVLPGLTGETGLAGWARMMSPNASLKNIPSTPQLMDTPDVLKGKTITLIAPGRPLVLCSDGTLVEWRLAGPWPPNQPPTEAQPKVVDTSGVFAGKTIIALAAANPFSVALCSDGTLVAWGDTKYFGSGSAVSTAKDGTWMNNLDESLLEWHPNHTYTEDPTLVDTSGALHNKQVVAISASDWHALALCSDGSVVEWGLDGLARDIDDAIAQNGPPQMYEARVVNTGALQGRKVVAIAAGPNQNLALCADGTLATWGKKVGRRPTEDRGFNQAPPIVVVTSPINPAAAARSAAPPNGTRASGPSTALHGNASQAPPSNPGITRGGPTVAIGSSFVISSGAPTAASRPVNNFGENIPVAVNTSGVLARKDIVGFAPGPLFSLALCADGTVAIWGDKVPRKFASEPGYFMSLADWSANYTGNPVRVNTASGLNEARVAAVAESDFGAFVYESDGTLITWGQTDYPVDNRGVGPFYMASGGGWIGNGHVEGYPAALDTSALKGKVILGFSGSNNISSNLGGNLILFQTPVGSQASSN